uniref:Uncharacterized protein n=1 Tax=Anguilla anguilla TaxID=7936 RepID=A0A0E9SCV8_ANGAN
MECYIPMMSLLCNCNCHLHNHNISLWRTCSLFPTMKLVF